MSFELLKRVRERPDPENWDLDELLTLPEAVALLWPNGPLSVRSLRTASQNGELVMIKIAGKHFVSRRRLLEMCRR